MTEATIESQIQDGELTAKESPWTNSPLLDGMTPGSVMTEYDLETLIHHWSEWTAIRFLDLVDDRGENVDLRSLALLALATKYLIRLAAVLGEEEAEGVFQNRLRLERSKRA